MGRPKKSPNHDIGAILRESLDHERASLKLYYDLLDLVKDRHLALDECARGKILAEEMHIGEVDKMLRKPGELDKLAK